jgi:carbon-monoxide dehydrogenase medium subunit
VKPARFSYARPESVEETLAVLDEQGSAAKILAGGQSLVPMMNMRLARPDVLVDVNKVGGLEGIRVDGTVAIGALTRQAAVASSPEVARTVPLLTEAMQHVGHPATRNRGTFGGMIAHADPAAEAPAVLLALGGEVVARSFAVSRTIAADEFFRSYFTTALEENELLVEVRVRVQEGRHTFLEVARRHGDFALVGIAATADLDGEANCTGARFVFFGVGSTPVRARSAEEALVGRPLAHPSVAQEVGRAAVAELVPADDVHATSDYRKEVAGVLARRAVERMAEAGAA